MTLLGVLGSKGARLSARSIAARLGCSWQHARKLLFLLLQLRDAQDLPLPLSSQDGSLDELELAWHEGGEESPIALSPSELAAVLSALARAGLGPESGFAQRVNAALGPEGKVSPPRPTGPDVAGNVARVAAALMSGQGLSFMYSPGGGEGPQLRHVSPQGLREEGSLWYLDSFDQNRGAERTFRLDRMSRLALFEKGDIAAGSMADTNGRGVRLRFDSPRWLDVFHWPGLLIEDERDGQLICSIPYYGGTWLARQVCACAGQVRTEDGELSEGVRQCAREMLELLDERHAS